MSHIAIGWVVWSNNKDEGGRHKWVRVAMEDQEKVRKVSRGGLRW